MKIILSIKPEFANKIFDGSKKYEFRRTLFKNRDVDTVIVYASAPISKVIGEFNVGEVLDLRLEELWNSTKEYSGITKDFYDLYFEGKDRGFAIAVKRAKRYKKELGLEENYGVKPPQSFVYVR